MSTVEHPEVLAREGNIAVIQMPGRRFPGLFIQGDSLANIRQLFADLADSDELPDQMLEARHRIDEFMSFYEAVLHERGIQLPY